MNAPTLEDVRRAIALECGSEALARIEERARYVANAREFAANKAELDRELDQLDRPLSRNDYLKTQARIDALFAAQRRLTDAAYPASKAVAR